MITNNNLLNLTDRVFVLKTSTNLYLRIENVNSNIINPNFILTNSIINASEFVFVKQSDESVSIRLNKDLCNKNNKFGYYLYISLENDLVYGAGDNDIMSHFYLEQHEQFIYIKSVIKKNYLCHKYNILRCSPVNTHCGFLLENPHSHNIPQTICIISYGYIRHIIDFNNIPILKTLNEIYPLALIDIYIHSPENINEFYNTKYIQQSLISKKYNIITKFHQFNEKYFMNLALTYNLPLLNQNNNYSFRNLSTLWHISEAVKMVSNQNKTYTHYILLRTDQYDSTNIIQKQLDTSKLFCLKNNKLDSHLFIGKDILLLNQLYDYYLINKNMFIHENVDNIIHHFLKSRNVQFGNIDNISPTINYIKHFAESDTYFYKTILSKYHEIQNTIEKY